MWYLNKVPNNKQLHSQSREIIYWKTKVNSKRFQLRKANSYTTVTITCTEYNRFIVCNLCFPTPGFNVMLCMHRCKWNDRFLTHVNSGHGKVLLWQLQKPFFLFMLTNTILKATLISHGLTVPSHSTLNSGLTPKLSELSILSFSPIRT